MKIKTNTITMVCLGNAGAALAHALAENFPRSGYDVDPKRKTTVADLETAWSDSAESGAADASIVLLSPLQPEISCVRQM